MERIDRLCAPQHEKEVVALCKIDHTLVCNECLRTSHLEHPRVFLTTLAKNVLYYAQEVANSAEDAEQNCAYILSTLNKDDIVAGLHAKLDAAFQDVIQRLSERYKRMVEELDNCTLLKEFIQNTQMVLEQQKTLRGLRNEIDTVRNEIAELIHRRESISVLRLQSQLAVCESQVAGVTERLNVGTLQLQSTALGLESLASQFFVSDAVLDKLLNISLVQPKGNSERELIQVRPSTTMRMQKPESLNNTSNNMSYDSLGSTLAHPLSTLLLNIESVKGKEVGLYDIPTASRRRIKLPRDFKVPLNYGLIEHPNLSVLYITGGWLLDKYHSETYEYTLGQPKIAKLAPMSCPRRSHAATYCQYPIVCGGENSSGYLSSCERYNPVDSKWETLGKLNESKSYATACGMNDTQVYVFGGYTCINGVHKTFDTIEMLDLTHSDAWTLIRLPAEVGWSPRQDVGAIQVSGEQILLFGGYNQRALKDTWLFNATTSELQSAGRLQNEERFYQRIPKFYLEKVYVVGSRPASTVLCFDLLIGKWTELPLP